jgi:predicted ATPase/class 3 adenylate cyclase
MQNLPTGTVTFLYTDIEGSTRRWDEHPEIMKAVLQRHDAIVRQAITSSGGVVFRTMGDAFCAVFPLATQGVAAALAAQRALNTEPWPPQIGSLRVRMALHTGTGEVRDADYVGPPLNRVARLLSAGHGGQTLLSQAAYDLARVTLSPGVALRDLGEHRLKDLQQPEHIFQLVTPDLPSDFPPLNVLDKRPNNLPIQRRELVGREKELAAVHALLTRESTGLLTLTGPGGTGKTRLALQIAADLIDDFPDGAYFVNLTPIREPSLVISTISQTIDLRVDGGRSPAESLKEFLRDKRMLLVLDNFEQVLEAAPAVSELLAIAPRLKVLVTSRAVLHLVGEQEYRVPALQLPDPARLPPLAMLPQYGAIALFVERAQLVNPAFELTSENAVVVAEICQKLDGLPLAIELAAARIRLLPPQAMLGRLESRLRLLTGGARDLPAHQQTLRSAVGWSYDLLGPAEQQLFRRMSLFVGGCTLEAAEAVCGDVDVGNDAGEDAGDVDMGNDTDMLEDLSSLLDKSLLHQDELNNEPRFRMLETIREYGLEMLDASGEKEAIQDRHTAYFSQLIQDDWHELSGSLQSERMSRIEAEWGNIQAVLASVLGGEPGDLEIALQMCWNLILFWVPSRHIDEGRMWAERAVNAPGAAAMPSYAKGLIVAGSLARVQGDHAASRALIEQVVPLLRAQGDKQTLGHALFGLAEDAVWQEGPEAARPLYEESIALLKEVGDEYGLSQALITAAGVATHSGDFDRARSFLEDSLAILRKRGSFEIGRVLDLLGDIARIERDYAAAEAYYGEALAFVRRGSIKVLLPALLHNIGHVAVGKGEIEEARKLFEESLAEHLETKDKAGVAESLAGFAAVATARGEGAKAGRLFGAAAALWEVIGAPMWLAERAEWERNVAAARRQLDDATWQSAWAEGRAMSMEEAIEYALEQQAE